MQKLGLCLEITAASCFPQPWHKKAPFFLFTHSVLFVPEQKQRVSEISCTAAFYWIKKKKTLKLRRSFQQILKILFEHIFLFELVE